MDIEKTIRYTTLLLALTAGFCDTTTFVAADQLFSAHVTGNFIVLAYDIVKHVDSQAWIKLLTFPIFILSVIGGGYIASKASSKYLLLLAEGSLLILVGLADFIWRSCGFSGLHWQEYTMAMFIVVAMGIQNAFGKIFSKDTLGPTTMMTGNVTQAALDLGVIIFKGFGNLPAVSSFKNQLITIISFLVGCLSGGLIANDIGLTAIIFPGIALFIFSLKCHFQQHTPA